VTAQRAIPIFPKLEPDAIRERLQRHEFFWADLTLDEEVSLGDIRAVFGLDAGPAGALGHFPADGRAGGAPMRKVHVDAEHVVFPFW
jgi:hypothetical protein